jgi:CRISPR system Cascade subunit CasA
MVTVVPSFDLIDQPWIPVTDGGRSRLVSLADALAHAHEIDGLALDDPLQAVAVFRQVLLPVVLDALGAPTDSDEWAERWRAGVLDAARIGDYLEENRPHFDLFDPDRPFAQVASLEPLSGNYSPTSLLLPSVAAQNNVPLFSAFTDSDAPALTPAEAARALLSTHCWDTAGIKSGAVGDSKAKQGKAMGNPTGPLGRLGVVIPLGRTLAESLVLNEPILPQGLRPADRPQWRAEPITAEWQQRPAVGLLDLLTWQARRIRLIAEDGAAGLTVRHVVVAAGDRLQLIPESDELHTAWKQLDKPAAGQAPRQPILHQPGRAAWQGLTALLATQENPSAKVSSSVLLSQLGNLQADGIVPEQLPLQVLAVGVAYGNQSAIIEDTMTDLIPLPVVALASATPLRDLLSEIVLQSEQLRLAANRLGDDLRLASGGAKIPWDHGQHLGDVLVHALDSIVRRLLAGLQREPERLQEARLAWRSVARSLALEVAEPALVAVPPTSFVGREVRPGIYYRQSTAERSYRAALHRVLGPPPTELPTDRTTDRGV